MSDSTRDTWPNPEAGLAEHYEKLKEGSAQLNSAMELPADGRFDVAYTLLATGADRQGAVLSIGPAATGKSQFGNIVYGEGVRHDVAPEEDATSLFGFRNPINNGEVIEGSLLPQMEERRELFINEASQLRNVAPFLRLFEEGDFRTVDGRAINMAGAAIYLTSNFPTRTRVHELDPALRSRLAVEILTGDADKHEAQGVQRSAWSSETRVPPTSPLLPAADTRVAIKEKVARAYPVGNPSELSAYTVELADILASDPMLSQADNSNALTDARLSHALRETARARMIVDAKPEGTSIDIPTVASVAALVMPKMFKLSPAGKAMLRQVHGGEITVRSLDEAIIIRRLVASAAFNLSGLTSTAGPNPEHIRTMTDRYSYANAKALAFETGMVEQAATDLRQGAALLTRTQESANGPTRRNRRLGKR